MIILSAFVRGIHEIRRLENWSRKLIFSFWESLIFLFKNESFFIGGLKITKT